jgi:hypothetical protein
VYPDRVRREWGLRDRHDGRFEPVARLEADEQAAADLERRHAG